MLNTTQIRSIAARLAFDSVRSRKKPVSLALIQANIITLAPGFVRDAVVSLEKRGNENFGKQIRHALNLLQKSGLIASTSEGWIRTGTWHSFMSE